MECLHLYHSHLSIYLQRLQLTKSSQTPIFLIQLLPPHQYELFKDFEKMNIILILDLSSLGNRFHHLLGVVEKSSSSSDGGWNSLLFDAGKCQSVFDGYGMCDAHTR